MRFFVRVAAPALGLLLVLAARTSAAADATDQIDARNKSAAAAYEAGNFDKMKSLLAKAIALGEDKESDAASSSLALTYMLEGVLQIDGLDQHDAGVRFFAKALKLAPDVQIPKGMATTPVKTAFKEAKGEAAAAPAEASGPSEADREKDKERAAAAEAERDRDRDRQDRERERQDKQSRAERDRQQKELALAKEGEEKEHVEKERLQREKGDRDKQLTELKSEVQQLDKDKTERQKALQQARDRMQELERDKTERDKQIADRDKQIADAKARQQQLEKDKADRDKQIATGAAREKNERDAKEKLQKEKVDRDKVLADTKARVQQLEKDKADRDKQIALLTEKERRSRDSMDKMEKERQAAAAMLKEEENRKDQDRREREKRAQGPDMPSRVPEPLYCVVPDEAQAGADLFVHCVPQGSVHAKVIAFYYRAGSMHFNSVAMEHMSSGWYTTVIPGEKLVGKVLQYYAEARDAKDSLAAGNGKAASPNILTLRPSGATIARARR
jgi:hypothetical protein